MQAFPHPLHSLWFTMKGSLYCSVFCLWKDPQTQFSRQNRDTIIWIPASHPPLLVLAATHCLCARVCVCVCAVPDVVPQISNHTKELTRNTWKCHKWGVLRLFWPRSNKVCWVEAGQFRAVLVFVYCSKDLKRRGFICTKRQMLWEAALPHVFEAWSLNWVSWLSVINWCK